MISGVRSARFGVENEQCVTHCPVSGLARPFGIFSLVSQDPGFTITRTSTNKRPLQDYDVKLPNLAFYGVHKDGIFLSVIIIIIIIMEFI